MVAYSPLLQTFDRFDVTHTGNLVRYRHILGYVNHMVIVSQCHLRRAQYFQYIDLRV